MAVRDLGGSRLRSAARSRPLPLVAALYVGAAVLATWPAAGRLGSAFAVAEAPAESGGQPVAGDHLQSSYRFWLVGHQLARGAAPWRDPYSFQPLAEPQVVLGGWPFGFAYWFLEAAVGATVAWNLLLMATVVAAGFLAYGWLRALALRPAAAAIGGLAFALAPYRIEQSGGHLLGWVALLLPLALLALERSRAAATPARRHGWGALAAAALVSVPLAGQLHLALGAIPFVLAYAGVRFGRAPAAWSLAGALGAAAVGIAARYTVIAGSAQAGGRSLAEVREFQAGWLDLVSRWQLAGSEQFVYLGWLTPALALAGLVLLWRRRRALALVLGLSALVPVLLALGTNLPLYEPLRDLVPPLRYPRVPARLLPIADLALAGLAAFAVAALLARLALRAATVTAATLVLLVAADLAVLPLEAGRADPGNEAYRALAAEPSGRVLELPLFEPGVHYGSVYDYYQLQEARERPGGYSTLGPEVAFAFYFERNRLSCGVWLAGDREQLQSLGVHHILFHRGLYEQGDVPGAWFGWRGLVANGYAPFATGGAVTLFAPGGESDAEPPVPEPPRDRPVLCQGWRARTMIEREAPLWIHGEGRLRLDVTAPGSTVARLSVDGRAVASFDVDGGAGVTVDVRGAGWHAVVLEVPRLFDTDPVAGLTLERISLE